MFSPSTRDSTNRANSVSGLRGQCYLHIFMCLPLFFLYMTLKCSNVHHVKLCTYKRVSIGCNRASNSHPRTVSSGPAARVCGSLLIIPYSLRSTGILLHRLGTHTVYLRRYVCEHPTEKLLVRVVTCGPEHLPRTSPPVCRLEWGDHLTSS